MKGLGKQYDVSGRSMCEADNFQIQDGGDSKAGRMTVQFRYGTAVTVLAEAPRHAGVWRSGGKAALVRNPGTRS